MFVAGLLFSSRRPVGFPGRTAADFIALLGPGGVRLMLFLVRYQAGANRLLAFLSVHEDLRKPEFSARHAPGQPDNSLARAN